LEKYGVWRPPEKPPRYPRWVWLREHVFWYNLYMVFYFSLAAASLVLWLRGQVSLEAALGALLAFLFSRFLFNYLYRRKGLNLRFARRFERYLEDEWKNIYSRKYVKIGGRLVRVYPLRPRDYLLPFAYALALALMGASLATMASAAFFYAYTHTLGSYAPDAYLVAGLDRGGELVVSHRGTEYRAYVVEAGGGLYLFAAPAQGGREVFIRAWGNRSLQVVITPLKEELEPLIREAAVARALPRFALDTWWAVYRAFSADVASVASHASQLNRYGSIAGYAELFHASLSVLLTVGPAVYGFRAREPFTRPLPSLLTWQRMTARGRWEALTGAYNRSKQEDVERSRALGRALRKYYRRFFAPGSVPFLPPRDCKKERRAALALGLTPEECRALSYWFYEEALSTGSFGGYDPALVAEYMLGGYPRIRAFDIWPPPELGRTVFFVLRWWAWFELAREAERELGERAAVVRPLDRARAAFELAKIVAFRIKRLDDPYNLFLKYGRSPPEMPYEEVWRRGLEIYRREAEEIEAEWRERLRGLGIDPELRPRARPGGAGRPPYWDELEKLERELKKQKK